MKDSKWWPWWQQVLDAAAATLGIGLAIRMGCQLLPADGGSSRSGLHREAHVEPAPPDPHGTMGRKAVIICLRTLDVFCAFFIAALVVLWLL